LLRKKLGFDPTFYCCVNKNVIEQFAEEIENVQSIKFLSSYGKGKIANNGRTFFMDSVQAIGFSKDIENQHWHEGWTVTYCAMQLAYYLGFSEVLLIGVDHSFVQNGPPNKTVEAKEADQNHFHPDYFGPGVKWQFPDLERSEQHYKIAKDVYEKDSRRIYDATVEGKLEIFPKINLESSLQRAPFKRIDIKSRSDPYRNRNFTRTMIRKILNSNRGGRLILKARRKFLQKIN
jgi:hypothetical protein